MHAHELVDLAALVSAHGAVLVRSAAPIPTAGIERYWTASKTRLDRWASRLKHFANADLSKYPTDDVLAVSEEILTGEVLTRVWSAVLCAYDKRRGGDDAEPVARSVMLGHMEARHRVLTLIARAQDSDVSTKLNVLRRRVERWTDLLIGHLMDIGNVSEFAFEADRARDFATDFHDRSRRQGEGLVWPLLTASLKSAFQQPLSIESPNADLNARIGGSVLACFPAQTFDATGLPTSLWIMQLMDAAEDTQGMVDALLSPAPSSAGRFRGDGAARLRRFRG